MSVFDQEASTQMISDVADRKHQRNIRETWLERMWAYSLDPTLSTKSRNDSRQEAIEVVEALYLEYVEPSIKTC